jgi:hypothetical protein
MENEKAKIFGLQRLFVTSLDRFLYNELMTGWITTIASAVIFLAAVLISTMDAQGAIVFLFAFPACFILLAIGYGFSKARSGRRAVLAMAVVLLLFIGAHFVPPLRVFPQSVAHGVTFVFERLTGLSPYAWSKQNNPTAKQLLENLNATTAEVGLAQMSAVPGWSRICIFGPHSTEEDAAKVIGYFSATLEQSRVRSEDSVAALVFINDRGTLAVIDVPRSILDFAPLSRTCLTSKDFPLPVDESPARKVIRQR